MGLVSHSRQVRMAKPIVAPPATPGKRQCQGEIFVPFKVRYEWLDRNPYTLAREYRQYKVEPHYRQCRAMASAYVPEVDYCAHHMPTEWVTIANARAELWNQLSIEAWEHILDQHPGKEPSAHRHPG